MDPYQVFEKVIISGSYIEHYTYEKGYWVGWPKERVYRPQRARFRPQMAQESIREDNVRRTRIKIRRLVNCNQDLVKFMTLTFDSSFPSLNEANPLFHNFIKRITRLYPDFKYLCVPEFQKDKDHHGNIKPNGGSVHYHLLCNLPFIDNSELKRIWGNGFVFIRRVNNVDNLGAYVCKYLGKANFDVRYFKRRKFFNSFNLTKSIVIDVVDKVRQIIFSIPKTLGIFLEKFFEMEFFTKYLGMCYYKQYKLADFIKVADSS